MDCPLEDLKNRVKKLRVIFKTEAPAQLHLTEIIRQENRGREMTITLANDCEQKRRVLETYKPDSIDEIPMSLEDIFIECTNPTPANLTIELNREPNHVDAD